MAGPGGPAVLPVSRQSFAAGAGLGLPDIAKPPAIRRIPPVAKVYRSPGGAFPMPMGFVVETSFNLAPKRRKPGPHPDGSRARKVVSCTRNPSKRAVHGPPYATTRAPGTNIRQNPELFFD